MQLGIDIRRALEICERRDIIHRDIKPDNIMMSDFGNFKLGDFGISTDDGEDHECVHGWNGLVYGGPEVAKKMKYRKSVGYLFLGLS